MAEAEQKKVVEENAKLKQLMQSAKATINKQKKRLAEEIDKVLAARVCARSLALPVRPFELEPHRSLPHAAPTLLSSRPALLLFALPPVLLSPTRRRSKTCAQQSTRCSRHRRAGVRPATKRVRSGVPSHGLDQG